MSVNATLQYQLPAYIINKATCLFVKGCIIDL